MVLMVFLLYLSTSKGQNEEVRTDDFMNFLNPIDSQEKIQSQNIEHFIQQYLNFNDDILHGSDNHAEIQAQEQNNMDSDLFCEIPCDSSLMNIENISSISLFDPTSDHKPLYDEIKFSLDSTSLREANPTFRASVSSIEPDCQCVGLCLCITTPKPDNTTLDIDYAARIDSNILSSDIVLTNKQDQRDEIRNKDPLQFNPRQIECEIEEDFNLTEQCLKQEIYPDITENIQSPKQTKNITLPSNTRLNPKNPVPIKKIYLDNENKMTEESGVKTKLKAEKKEISRTVHPSTSQEIVISGVKNAKKRKYTDESNKIAKRKTENVASIEEESNSSFNSGGSKTCLNISENELLVDQTKTIYDPDSQDDEEELDFHLKNCNYYANLLLRKLIIEIDYENSQITNVKYVTIQSNQEIPKTEKSKKTLYIFGTFINKPSIGGSTFTVRVQKLFEDGVQIERRDRPLARAFVPTTNADTYNLTLKMSRIHSEQKLPSASFKLDNETEYVPSCFYAYHFKQVIRFKYIRRTNNVVFYYFEYKPEKKINA
ncbi:hypothetical protein M153_5400004881 [Pseudoloma neurophilia]|uniref:Uncharacterized protein n=1 Tax=Pseudoloma neurophilia TaxID=146866 RepID=A0A0R0M5X4_9MICR|nr:hypothetical protein M153_5400004881 [Pseudoloma neurophilia]